MNEYYVYILSNPTYTTLYIGVTHDLERRIHEHAKKGVEGFTRRYNVSLLVYYEHTNDVLESNPARETTEGLVSR